MTELYIITDALGFTSASHPTQSALGREMARRPLQAPATVWHWATNSRREWVLKETFVWGA